jgi:formylglycine-generating enzyme required for sulfatase activity
MGVYPVTKGQFAAFVQAEDYKTDVEAGRGPADSGGGMGYDAAKQFVLGEPKYKFSWKNTGFEQTDAHPVVNVTWSDAVAFCKWLSKKEGKRYELPTEAEWEYACRAGTRTRFWCGDDVADLKGKANLGDASLKKLSPYLAQFYAEAPWDDGFPFTSPVGAFRPNPWGLYDMHGNVAQWCADRYGKYEDGNAKDPQGPASGQERVLRGSSCVAGELIEEMCRCAARNQGGEHAINARMIFNGFRVVLRPAVTTP